LYCEFKISESTYTVVYADINTYQVEQYNGTHLKIKFKNGTDFKILANSNFCDSEQFEAFCIEFERIVQQFMSTNNVALTRKNLCLNKYGFFHSY
jgi:hypothetical protein